MNKSDYDKYYKKGGTYVIPVEIFNELFDELERQISNYEQALEDLDKKENIIKEVREYIKDKWEMELKDSMEDFLDHDELIDKKRLLHILEILDREVK